MVHRGIATISAALMVCFLLLSHFDAQFYLIHFYESLLYLAILVMLFYFEDRGAYMFGMVAPAIWLVLIYGIGAMPGMMRQGGLVARLQHPDYVADFIGALIIGLSALMIVFCAYRWRRELSGAHKGLSTLAPARIVAAIYYGVMAVWVLRWPPIAS
jgi:hypothetical protein